MKISKFTYIFVASILMLSFWNFRPIVSVLNRDIILAMTLLWGILGFFLPTKRIPVRYFYKYNWLWIGIFAGVFISMLNADFFWGQSIKTTFIAQRFSYAFILLPVLFYVQPSVDDLLKTIRIVAYITLGMWLLSIIAPGLIGNISEDSIESRNANGGNTTDIGFYVTGIQFVVLYTYYLIQRYIRCFTYKRFFTAIFWIAFIILYQNRSMMIGIMLIMVYSLFQLKSKNKPIIIGSICIITVIFIVCTWQIWSSLLTETQAQLGDKDYNRWKALFYYFNDYSPNLWCYLFGNGFPSGGNSDFGNLMWINMARGIYASDLGMIGMWTDYGLLPLISVYYVILRVLIKKGYPLWLKFMCVHILVVPTIFHFRSGQGIWLFIIIIYLFIYYSIKLQIRQHIAKQLCSRNQFRKLLNWQQVDKCH